MELQNLQKDIKLGLEFSTFFKKQNHLSIFSAKQVQLWGVFSCIKFAKNHSKHIINGLYNKGCPSSDHPHFSQTLIIPHLGLSC